VKIDTARNIFGGMLAALCLGLSTLPGMAQKFHCEADTAKAMEIIREFHNPGGDPAKICGPVASRLVGVPYVQVTKEDSLGVAEIRLDGFDDFSFVNMVAALAKTATSPGHSRAKDLEMALEKLTFRRGEADGFPSRMVYGGDWIVDNRARGNVKELTEDFSNNFKTKSLDYVGRHRDEYVALKDSATYERQRMVEFGYRTFKIPHMKRESSEWKQVGPEIQDGDLIMLLTPEPDRDVWEMGYVVRRDDGLHFIHASERDGKVVEEPEVLGRYIKRHAKEVYGWRWIRIL
jgi:hypothetical protein